MVLPLDLIKTAKRLVRASGTRRPRQSDLKRAMSTAYYALFHTLCRNCADCLIGGNNSARSAPAWRQAYRAVEHRFAKNQCNNTAVLARFPREIEDFASLFKSLQENRHAADYDPNSGFTRTDVLTAIDAAEIAIKQFTRVSIKDRRAFAAWTTMKNRSD